MRPDIPDAKRTQRKKNRKFFLCILCTLYGLCVKFSWVVKLALDWCE